MKQRLKKWWKDHAKEIIGLISGLILAIAGISVTTSCSTTQRINVKQSQGDQLQETTIEHGGEIKALSIQNYYNNGKSGEITLVNY